MIHNLKCLVAIEDGHNSFYGIFVSMPGLSTFPSVLTIFVLVLRLSATPFLSAILVLGPELSLPLFFIWFFLQIANIFPEKQRLGQWNGII